MILETERLILRPPRKEDWKDILEGAKDLEVSKHLLRVPHPYKKEDAITWIESCIKESKKDEPSKYAFFIELKSTGKVIGSTDIHGIDRGQGVAHTGSWINKKYWRMEYILEAKVPILDFAFGKLNLRKIETEAFVENIGSNAMSKKLGFKKEGTRREAVISKSTGKLHDEYLYGLLKKEWLVRRPKIVESVSRKIKKFKDA